MSQHYPNRFRHALVFSVLLLMLLVAGSSSFGQGSGGLIVNLAPLDGIAITPDNIFSFGVQSNMPASTNVEVNGTIRYRQSNLSLGYTVRTVIRPGMNQLNASGLRPEWSFSDGALRDLFLDNRLLPQGTYEYCVRITPLSTGGELRSGDEAAECLYQKSEDVFLINLVDPENNAKLYERYPVFSWVVNYPFASQLTYRIRVAEIREGQNAVNAVVRNNPVYVESNLPQTTVTYPVYSTPLKTGQPYGWTVDAYYKGILLGGAEAWQFTIVEDSEITAMRSLQAFYEFAQHTGEGRLTAIGDIKLKYLTRLQNDTLHLSCVDENGNKVKISPDRFPLHLGDNRIVLSMEANLSLRHKKTYTVSITTEDQKHFDIPLTYINPTFVIQRD